MRKAILGALFLTLFATQAHAIQATLNWTNPADSNRTGIKIFRADGGGPAPFVLQTPTPLGPSVTTFNQTGLLINTTYCWQIVPTGALGDAVGPANVCGTPNSPINVNGITIIFAP
jgi:hypothetical protein